LPLELLERLERLELLELLERLELLGKEEDASELLLPAFSKSSKLWVPQPRIVKKASERNAVSRAS
jgi:hypothetical protein